MQDASISLMKLFSVTLVTHLFFISSCVYDAKKELEMKQSRHLTGNQQYLKSYLQITIDSIIREIPEKNHQRLLNYVSSMYMNTKYSNIKSKNLKRRLLTRIKEIKRMITEGTYNRVLIMKLEQLYQLSNEIP